MTKTAKPDCYQCEYHKPLGHKGRIGCFQPKVRGLRRMSSEDTMWGILGTLEGLPIAASNLSFLFGITINLEGMLKGEFRWPFNYDPTWLEACDGFKQKKPVNAIRKRLTHLTGDK